MFRGLPRDMAAGAAPPFLLFLYCRDPETYQVGVAFEPPSSAVGRPAASRSL